MGVPKEHLFFIVLIQIDACGDLAPDSVCKANIFLFESVRIPAEHLSQSEIELSLRQICYYSSPIGGH